MLLFFSSQLPNCYPGICYLSALIIQCGSSFILLWEIYLYKFQHYVTFNRFLLNLVPLSKFSLLHTSLLSVSPLLSFFRPHVPKTTPFLCLFFSTPLSAWVIDPFQSLLSSFTSYIIFKINLFQTFAVFYCLLF